MSEHFIVTVIGNRELAKTLKQMLPMLPKLKLKTGLGHDQTLGRLQQQVAIISASESPPNHTKLLQILPPAAIIVLDLEGNVRSAIAWMKTGVRDYYVMNDDYERFIQAMARRYDEWLTRAEQNQANPSELTTNEPVGHPHNVERLKQVIAKAGRLKQLTVLIQGETGTGKGFLAHKIHESSAPKGNLIEINCAAIPEQLLESELFGHEAGSFTGAKQRKPGLIELAQHGTVLLDEIDSMPLDLQAKLLKFIEEKRFRRVGGETEIQFQGRIIACTNQQLSSLVEAGKFRSDLYYRLNIFPIIMPPLRAKPEDINPLINHFINYFASHYQLAITGIADSALIKLATHHWPGNIRELKHRIERAVVLREQGHIQADDFEFEDHQPAEVASSEEWKLTLGAHGVTLAEAECEVIRQVLVKNSGNRSVTAKILGIPRSRLHRKIKQYGLEVIGKLK